MVWGVELFERHSRGGSADVVRGEARAVVESGQLQRRKYGGMMGRMKARGSFRGLLVLLQILALVTAYARPARAAGTVFFPATGYSVGGLALSEFVRLGGVAALGYPISVPYEAEGFWWQAFQRGIMQWGVREASPGLMNVMDWFHENGYDGRLAQLGIPMQYVGEDGSRGDLEVAAETQFAWLTRDEIRRHYYNHPTPQAIWGLPTSLPERYGPFISQRFQKGVLQLWVEEVPGMPAKGSVVGALVGELARQVGLVPEGVSGDREGGPSAAIYHGPRETARVAITLDDGWYPYWVEEALRIAQNHEVELTFFPVGKAMGSQAELWRRAVREGHEIGNHTFNHRRLVWLSDEEVVEEIDAVSRKLDDALGGHYAMRFLRPPNGLGGWNGGDARILRIAEEKGLRVVMWSIDESRSATPYDHIVSQIQGGDIILLHLTARDVGILDQLVGTLLGRGFELTTVSGVLEVGP